MAMTPDRLKSMFNDLGKATKRGVRRCPSCSTINGTRGLTCKNRKCEFVFKEGGKKSAANNRLRNAVQVVTGSNVQVFSVRVHDRGPDYRGFVQLPLIQDLDGNPAENVDPGIMMSVLSSSAKCYVDNCPRSKQNNESVPVCVHIKSSIQCSEEAQAVTIKNSVLNALQVDADIKESIWYLATETSAPLVQRATKNIFIVKCKPNAKHPLGFLHFAFFSSVKGKEGKKAMENKFVCTCKQFKSYPKAVLPNEENHRKCIHFYACVCAFACDDNLSKEFAYFINLAQFTEILPESIETAVVLEADGSTPNIIIKNGGDDSVCGLTHFDSLGDQGMTFTPHKGEELEIEEQQMCVGLSHDSAEASEEAGEIAVEGMMSVEEVSSDSVHAEHTQALVFEGTEEDIVTDMGDITEQGKVESDGLQQSLITTVTSLPVVTILPSSTTTTTTSRMSLINLKHLDKPTTLNIAPIEDSDQEECMAVHGQHVQLDECMAVHGQHVQLDGNIEVIIDNNNLMSVSTDGGPTAAKRSRLADENVVIVSEPTDTIAEASSALLTLQEVTAVSSSSSIIQTTSLGDTKPSTTVSVVPTTTAEYKIIPKRPTLIKPVATSKTPPVKKIVTDESSLQISFYQWLASVTERINLTMHYQFNGNPEPLVFHAPQPFFECLQTRISAGSRKKRLPNSTTAFIRRDALPLGAFTKYTWHITNILHVKQIFDSPDMALDVTRSFIENKDGTFDLYDKNKGDSLSPAGGEAKNQYLPIRPFELKTYLKVGHTSATQKDATPFVIEWIPDILPKSRIGELRIKFEYGHQRNGQMENRNHAMTSVQM